LAFCLSLAGLLSFTSIGCNLSKTAELSTPAPSTGSGMAIQGAVHGGQQPIVGAHVYLLAANTTGYGGPGIAPSASNASISLLSAASTGHSDFIGAYVLTNGNGAFSITGDYTCTQNSQVYLYALGGNPGAGVNSAAGLLAILGNCPSAGNFLGSTPFISVNEVSTIAAAYAFAGFASDATHVSSSGTALAQVGIQNAFANAANLADISTGAALATTPAGNGAVPQSTINTLANILASCVNSSGAVTGPTNPTPCYTLFDNALSGGSTGAIPSDTALAAINIAHNPGANIPTLFALPTPQSPFAPSLDSTSFPQDFAIGVRFTGGFNFSATCAVGFGNDPEIAIDASGNVWVMNPGSNTVVKLSNSGSVLSGANGFTGGGLNCPGGIAVDEFGNVWVPNTVYPGSVTKLSNAGGMLSGPSGFTGGGLNGPAGIAIDGLGNVWTPDDLNGPLIELSNSGTFLSGPTGFLPGVLAYSIAIDGGDNVWLTDNANPSRLVRLSNSASLVAAYTNSDLQEPYGVAIDGFGNAWVCDGYTISVLKFPRSGTVSVYGGVPPAPFIGVGNCAGIAIDGSGTAWITNSAGSNNEAYVTGISSSGTILAGYYKIGFGVGTGIFKQPVGIAIDGSGNSWVANVGDNSVTELIGIATPVITPIAAGLPATPTPDGTSNLGTRP
jgi:hypothetical protein